MDTTYRCAGCNNELPGIGVCKFCPYCGKQSVTESTLVPKQDAKLAAQPVAQLEPKTKSDLEPKPEQKPKPKTKKKNLQASSSASYQTKDNKNDKLTFVLSRKTAEHDGAVAQFYPYLLYQDGGVVAQDYHKAVSWYGKAAEQGNAKAQNNLGGMYANGLGVPQDDQEAVRWYHKAAEQNDAFAQNNLGWMFENGRGVSPSNQQAVIWYLKAAKQGNADAQNNLGVLYAIGKGVEQDLVIAHKWFNIAASSKNVEAIKESIENLDIIRKKMTQTQIARSSQIACKESESYPEETVQAMLAGELDIQDIPATEIINLSSSNKQISTEAKETIELINEIKVHLDIFNQKYELVESAAQKSKKDLSKVLDDIYDPLYRLGSSYIERHKIFLPSTYTGSMLPIFITIAISSIPFAFELNSIAFVLLLLWVGFLLFGAVLGSIDRKNILKMISNKTFNEIVNKDINEIIDVLSSDIQNELNEIDDYNKNKRE